MPSRQLGDRMKELEQWTASMPRLPAGLPYAVRIDGKAFSKWTHGMQRPYDPHLIQLMQETAFKIMQFLLTECVLAYGQSDEVTFVFKPTEPGQTGQFGLKRQKLESLTASGFTAYFNNSYVSTCKSLHEQGELTTGFAHKPPALFDARAICLPSTMEAHNLVLWRQQDATRNSIQMAARSVASHNECQGLNSNQLQELLFNKASINWDSYPTEFKRGWAIRRETKVLEPHQLTDIPEKHRPTHAIERKFLKLDLDMPILTQDVTYVQELLV